MMLIGLTGDDKAANNYAAKQLVEQYGFTFYDMHWQVESMLVAAHGLTSEDLINAETTTLPGQNITVQDAIMSLYNHWGKGFMGSDYWVKNAEHYMAAMQGLTNGIVFINLDIATKSWLRNKGGKTIHISDSIAPTTANYGVCTRHNPIGLRHWLKSILPQIMEATPA